MSMTTLRRLRERRALTLDELASLANVTTSTIWRAEVGRSQPGPRTRRKIAAALGCDPSALVEQLIEV